VIVRLASLPSLGALIMLVSAPAMASGHEGLLEICTAQGPAWIDLPGAPAPPERRDHQIACAHAVCPRESDLRRKARTGADK
jgi:hypothetical protein